MGKPQQTILCVIPARGGSKGVPRKNIFPIAGRPLISYTIQAALESKVITKLVVSTDDDEIVSVSVKWGADVVRRPAELATDTAVTELAMRHVLEEVEKSGHAPDFIALIQCTSPLLTAEVIRQAVNKVMRDGFDSCITVFYPDGYEFKWRKNLDGSFTCEHDPENRPRRQDLNLPHHENGAFYITRTELFKKTNSRFGGRDARVAAVEMSEADSLQIDSLFHTNIAASRLEARINVENEKGMKEETRLRGLRQK